MHSIKKLLKQEKSRVSWFCMSQWLNTLGARWNACGSCWYHDLTRWNLCIKQLRSSYVTQHRTCLWNKKGKRTHVWSWIYEGSIWSIVQDCETCLAQASNSYHHLETRPHSRRRGNMCFTRQDSEWYTARNKTSMLQRLWIHIMEPRLKLHTHLALAFKITKNNPKLNNTQESASKETS